MTDPAENKPFQLASEQGAARMVSRLKTALAARDWKAADSACNALRYSCSWTYARFAEEFGAEQWEQHAQALDAATAGDLEDGQDPDAPELEEWECAVCKRGYVAPLGALGYTQHGRCRDCGAQQSRRLRT